MSENKSKILTSVFTAEGSYLLGLWVLPGAVGLILLISGLLKAGEMDLFIRQIKAYGIITNYVLLVIGSWAVILAECTLGMSLIVSYRPNSTIPLTVILLLIFSGLTSWAWITGVTEDCGCFGDLIKSSFDKYMILRNSILLVMTLFLLGGQLNFYEPLGNSVSYLVTGKKRGAEGCDK